MSELENLKEDLEELENVEDVEEEDVSTSNLFSISSFGVDYPVETLVSRLRKELFYIPHFQRDFVWSQNQASRFIESLLLGLPVPGIFLFKENDTGKHLVIDGQQRLRSLQYFYDGLFNKKEFKLTGLDSVWANCTYKTLDDSDRARLDDAVVHATVFKQDTPEGEMNSVYEVFERINTGGVKLSPQEIRSCICYGKFNDFLHSLNEEPSWRKVYGPKSKRLKDVELILRFFAFLDRAEVYSSPMKHFLNDYMKHMRTPDDKVLEHYRKKFVTTMSFVLEALGERPFRPERSLNTAVFDAVAPALAERLESGPEPSHESFKESYDGLLENSTFVEGYVRATAGEDNVDKRVSEAKKAILHL